MREIKFRAWDGMSMRYLDELYMVTKPMSGIVQQATSPDIIVWEKPESPFMQFTGLLDKNGKEIWEGDIVRTMVLGRRKIPSSQSTSGEEYYQEIQVPIIEQVVYHVDTIVSGFELVNINIKSIDNIDNLIGKSLKSFSPACEVIGNIYENPELLTKTI